MSVFPRVPNTLKTGCADTGRWLVAHACTTQEAEIRRTEVQSQPGQIDPILKKHITKKGLVESNVKP
jgi:hypothetical protein